MTRFSDRLRLSVSALAFMGGGLAATSARAVTITGTQTMVNIATLTDDLVVAGTGVISPGGINVGMLTGDMLNSGLIEGLANSAVSSTSSATLSIIQEATALVIQNGTYNLGNSGTISADSGADLSRNLSVTNAAGKADIELMDLVESRALSVSLENFDGTLNNSADLTISASASAGAEYILAAIGTNAEITPNDLDIVAAATAVNVSGDGYSVVNSGSISAMAAAGLQIDANVIGTVRSADFSMSNTAMVTASAMGVRGAGTVAGFENSGTVSAAAAAAADIAAHLTALEEMTINGGTNVHAFASGVAFETLEGDFDNSGTLTALASAELVSSVQALNSGISEVDVEPDTQVRAVARGVSLGNLQGEFINSSDESIEATALASAIISIEETGPDAGISDDTLKFTATATGVRLEGGEYTVDNSGTISARADSSLVFDANLVGTEAGASIEFTPFTVNAMAVGFTGSETSEGFANSGVVSATAAQEADLSMVANGETQATIRFAPEQVVQGSGVLLGALSGDFTNSGSIHGDAYGSLLASATVVKPEGSEAYISLFEADLDVFAIGASVDDFTGTLSNTGTDTISASADAEMVLALKAMGPDASMEINEIDVLASAEALSIDQGTYAVANSGNISANAQGLLDVSQQSLATGTTGSAEAELPDVSLSVFAKGAEFAGTLTAFSNSGTVAASALGTLTESIVASGETDATALAVNFVTVTAIGVSLQGTLNGDFDNSGTISALASAELASSLHASAVTASSPPDAAIDDTVRVFARAVHINEFNGSLTNSSPQTISATAAANVSQSIEVTGPGALAKADTATLTVSAVGLFIGDGIYDLSNTGSVSADSTANLVITASAVGTGGAATADLDDVEFEVYAIGIDARGDVTSFTNSGNVSASATVALTENASASGASSASVDVDSDITLEVTGIRVPAFAGAMVSGDFVNSGSVAAAGSIEYQGNFVSLVDGEPDFARIKKDFVAEVVGVDLAFSTPETGPLHSFTNDGDIAATGVLSMMQTVTAGAQDVPTSTMADPSDTPTITTTAELYVLGAWLTGGVGTVNNSGTITASGSIQAPDGYAAVSAVILPDAADGLVVNNDGEIIASLTGVAAESTVVALYLGPTETTEQASASSATTDYDETGLITVNNSGTISATNTTGSGPAIGIDIQNAPVPVEINQMGGEISGITAIAMDQGHDDVLNWTGGTIHGLVDADSGDVVNVFGGGVVVAPTDFALEGAGTVNVNLPGATSMEATTFQVYGSITNTGTLNINPYGNLYVGIPAVIELGGDTFNMAEDTSTLTIELQPGAAGSLSTTGDANIDGTLTAAPLAGLYLDTETFRIITAGVGGAEEPGTGEQTGTDVGLVNGTFDAVTGDTLLLQFSATINPSSVDLTYNRVPFDEAVPLSGNALSVAEGLEAGYDPTLTPSGNDPDLYDVLGNMFVLTDAGAYADTLFSWAGAEHAQVIGAAVNLAEPYHMAISEHLNDTRLAGGGEASTVAIRTGVGTTLTDPGAGVGSSGDGKKASFWGRAFGRWTSDNGDSNAPGYDEDTYGIVIGFDYAVAENVKVGIVGAYTSDDIKFDDNVDEADIERFTIGGYVSADIDKFYIDAAFSYFSDDYEVSRTVQYGDSSCPTFTCATWASSDYSGDGLLVHGELGYKLNPGNGDMVLQPFVGLDYSDVNIDGFAESGAGDLNLLVNDGGGESLQSRLGARLSANWNTGGSTIVRPELRVEWRHEFENDPRHFSAVLAGDTGIGFTTVGSKVTDDLVVIGAGATATFEGGINAFFEYQGAFGSGYSSHIIQLGARVPF